MTAFSTLVVDLYRAGELFAAVDDPVADRGDLVDILEDAYFGVEKGLGYQIDSHRMVRALQLLFVLVTPGDIVSDERAADGDPLHQTFSDEFLLLPVKQLIFQRRTTTVDCQNFHANTPPTLLSS